MKKLYLSFLFAFFGVWTSLQAQLPAITLKNIDGKSVRLDTLSNDNKPMILSFFATYCKPCLRELNAIKELYADWQEETGVKLVAVSVDKAQNINKVKPLADANEWSYEVLLDPNGELQRAMGAHLIPFVLVLDGNRKVVFKHNGYTDGAENELYNKVKEAAGQ